MPSLERSSTPCRGNHKTVAAEDHRHHRPDLTRLGGRCSSEHHIEVESSEGSPEPDRGSASGGRGTRRGGWGKLVCARRWTAAGTGGGEREESVGEKERLGGLTLTRNRPEWAKERAVSCHQYTVQLSVHVQRTI